MLASPGARDVRALDRASSQARPPPPVRTAEGDLAGVSIRTGRPFDELQPETVVHVVHVARRATDPLEQHSRLRAVMRPVIHHVRDELREHHLVRVALRVLVGDHAIGACIGQRLHERAEVGVGLGVGLAPRALDRPGGVSPLQRASQIRVAHST
jgi:hypothetical protein